MKEKLGDVLEKDRKKSTIWAVINFVVGLVLYFSRYDSNGNLLMFVGGFLILLAMVDINHAIMCKYMLRLKKDLEKQINDSTKKLAEKKN